MFTRNELKMNNKYIIYGILTVVVTFLSLLGFMGAIQVYDQYKLKQACEISIPRDKVCIVAYHPVEIVEWSEGVERKDES